MDMDLGKYIHTSRLMAAEIRFFSKEYTRESQKRESYKSNRI